MTIELGAELSRRGIDTPEIVARELFCVIRDTIVNQPRSQQVLPGPSELGMCTRALIHKLSGHHKPGSELAWKAYVGVGMHHNLALGFGAHALNQGVQPRFLIEHKVLIGSCRGVDIAGSCDLFDIDSGTVIDWKLVGKTQLAKYQRLGPGLRYQTQVHCYGKGFARAGYPVNTVMIVFLPRDLDLKIRPDGTFSGAWVYAEEYDERIADKALRRVSGLLELLEDMPAAELVEMYPTCNDYFCAWCRNDAPRPETTAELFGDRKELL